MNSDTAELGDNERGLHSATVATGVAGAEQQTRTGHRYNQISSSRVEPTFTKLGETSREEYSHFGEAVIPRATVEPGLATETHTCEGGGMPLEGWMTTVHGAQHPGRSEESSAQQTSFTKLMVEEEVESVENGARWKADTSTGDRDEVSTEAEFPRSLLPAEDFDRVQEDSDVEGLEEVGDESEAEEVLPDRRLDHPTSTEDVQSDDCDFEKDEEKVVRQWRPQTMTATKLTMTATTTTATNRPLRRFFLENSDG